MIETTNLRYLLSTSLSHRKLSKDALLDGTEPTVLAQWMHWLIIMFPRALICGLVIPHSSDKTT